MQLKARKLQLHWQILIAIALAVAAGSWSGADTAIFGVSFYSVYEFIGTLFLNALKMLVVPLIVSSIIVGVGSIGNSGTLGRLGGKTVLYYLASSALAVLVGLAVVNLLSPGTSGGRPVGAELGLQADASGIAEQVQGRDAGDLVGLILRMVPTNVVDAAANGELLGLIFFSLLFGYFLSRSAQPYAQTMQQFWQGTFNVMLAITEWVMKFAPIGVFALVAKVVATTGLSLFAPLAVFVAAVLAGLALHMFVVLPLLIAGVGRVRPWGLYRAMAPALLTAFSTSSSSATLPLTLECVEKNAGVPNRISSFVLPIGATVNMDGTALYECMVVMFIAQAYGIELSWAQQLSVVALALITSIGVAGIPSASLVAISMILTAVGLPLEGLALVLAADRVLDMCRTSVNVFSDACGAVIIARLNGEQGVLERDGARTVGEGQAVHRPTQDTGSREH